MKYLFFPPCLHPLSTPVVCIVMPSSTAFPSSPRNSIPSIQTNGAPLRRWPPLEEIVQDDPEASSFDASGTELPQPPSRSEPKYHTLFCGSSLASELDQQSQSCFREGSSWAPSPFPEVPEKHDAEPESPPTNGCGALLHLVRFSCHPIRIAF